MASWVKYLTIFIFSIIFAACLMNFIYNIQINNNSQKTIYDSDSPLGTFNNSLNNMLVNFNQNSNNQYNASSSESVTAPTGAFIMFSILTSLGRFFVLPVTFTNNLFDAVSKTLGVPPIILDTILALIILAGIFFWYRSVKTGD